MSLAQSSFNLAVAISVAVGCNGSVADAENTPQPTDTLPAGSGAEPEPEAGNMPGASPQAGLVPGPELLRRLTDVQYLNSVRELLDSSTLNPPELPGNGTNFGGQALTSVRVGVVTTDQTAVETYDAAARSLAAQALGTIPELTSCTPLELSCADSFVRSWGRRVFRRPLVEDEVARYVALISDAAKLQSEDPAKGFEMAVAAFLSSPHFLYRSSIGDASGYYTDYEMASRLSFLLWDTTPSSALLDKAAAGQLSDAGSVRSVAEEMLASDKAKAPLVKMFAEIFELDAIGEIVKDQQVFPGFAEETKQAMFTEMERVIEKIVWNDDASVLELFTTRETFINGALANIYGVSGFDGEEFRPYTHSEESGRAGLLTTAGWLARHSGATDTSPISRGLFLLQELMCQEFGEAPEGVPPLSATETEGPQTMRQRLESAHRTNPACVGCHQLIDPLGLAFEHFDGLGRYRETDDGLTLDVGGKMGDAEFDGPVQLQEAMLADSRLRTCLSQHAFRNAVGRLETPGEKAAILEYAEKFQAAGYRARDITLEIVTSDAFRMSGGVQ